MGWEILLLYLLFAISYVEKRLARATSILSSSQFAKSRLFAHPDFLLLIIVLLVIHLQSLIMLL